MQRQLIIYAFALVGTVFGAVLVAHDLIATELTMNTFYGVVILIISQFYKTKIER